MNYKISPETSRIALTSESPDMVNIFPNPKETVNHMGTEWVSTVLNSMLWKKPAIAFINNTEKSKIQSDFIKKSIDYMLNNPRYEAIYGFLTNDENINRDSIVKEEGGCILVNRGPFNPIEMGSFINYLLLPTINGKIVYNAKYGRRIYQPDTILDVIFEELIPEIKSYAKTYFKNNTAALEQGKKLGLPYVILQFILNEYGTDYLIDIMKADFLKGQGWEIFSMRAYDVYESGCSLLNVEKTFQMEPFEPNVFFSEKIYKALTSITLKGKENGKQWSPSKKTVSKATKALDSLLESTKTVPYSEELILLTLEKLRQNLDMALSYKAYCKKKNMNIYIPINEYVNRISNYEAAWYEISETAIQLSDLLANHSLISKVATHGLKYVITHTYVDAATRKKIVEMIPPSPEMEYHEAREMKRKFHIHYGPTNSGKTYCALEALKEAGSGVYLGPLRLLALEVQDKMNESGVPCSLLTGEEEDCIPNAKHIASTVEKGDVTQVYDCCVIDECQMIDDPARGFAWTKAILGMQAKDIYLCTAPEAVKMLIGLILMCDDEFEIIEHKRRSELVIQKPILFNKDYIEKGDAFITFSKAGVLNAAAELIRMGLKVSIIYGNLPYATRKKQVQRFLDGVTDVVVSTDAIGMGINLPVKRIVFLADEKFNGKFVTDIPKPLIKQIAGRAGRDKETGYVTSVKDNNRFIKEALNYDTPDITKAYLGYSDDIISIDAGLIDILNVWRDISSPAQFKKMDLDRLVELDKMIYVNVKKKDKLKMLTIPFDEKNTDVLNQWKDYCIAYEEQREIKKPVLKGLGLTEYETYYKQLGMYYAFSRNFGYVIDEEWLNTEKEKASDEINNILVQKAGTFRKKCKICGAAMKWDSPYSTCYTCGMMRYHNYV